MYCSALEKRMTFVHLTVGVSSLEIGLSCSQLNGQVLAVCNQLESTLQSYTDSCVDICINSSKFNGHL